MTRTNRTKTNANTKRRPATGDDATREIVRFKVGAVYLRGRSKYVCVERKHGESGDIVWLAEINKHRRNIKNFWNDVTAADKDWYVEYDEDCDEEWVAICAVRTFDGVEYASPVEDVEQMDELSVPKRNADGRFDFDAVEPIDKRKFAFRADRSCGEESVEIPDEPPAKKAKRRKSKKGNPLAGLVLIVAIVIIIRACTSL